MTPTAPSPDGGRGGRPPGRGLAGLIEAGIVLLFLVLALLLRGQSLSVWQPLNPDEAELMAQGRAALASPVPFTTWTMGTTGPFWVLFLAALGFLGFPLTIAFAHFLAAILVALIGYVSFLLMRRALGLNTGLLLVLLWWLPFVLIFPVGGTSDFGAMSTELLPALLVLTAALIPARRLAAHPSLFLVGGALCGIAVGAKYQVLPIAIALVLTQLIAVRWSPTRRIAGLGLFAAGAVAPFLPIVLAVVLSPDVSLDLLKQNFNFLGSYAGGIPLDARVLNTARSLLHQPYLLAMLLLLLRLAFISTRRVILVRVILVGAGLVAVFAGGKGFDHYLLILFAAVALAIAQPVREGAEFFPLPLLRRAAVVVAALAVVAVVVVGSVLGRFSFSTPAIVADTLSADSVTIQAGLARACPPGSDVLVWGWAPELYVNYAWHNTVPFMNTLGLSTNPDTYRASKQIVDRAVDESDCVVDAVGPPFFGVDASSSISAVYPEVAGQLGIGYHIASDAIECQSCTVYVRN